MHNILSHLTINTSLASLHIKADNADRFLIEDKVTSFARAIESKDIAVAQIGKHNANRQQQDVNMDVEDDVVNDMEVEEIESEFNQLEAINDFLKSNGLDPNNPNQILEAVSIRNHFGDSILLTLI